MSGDLLEGMFLSP